MLLTPKEYFNKLVIVITEKMKQILSGNIYEVDKIIT